MYLLQSTELQGQSEYFTQSSGGLSSYILTLFSICYLQKDSAQYYLAKGNIPFIPWVYNSPASLC